ncbi:MAG: class I tRNA ligase family protein, partial [Gemmatimonadota bacterium]|nr:class I tRNA ligase family protein [Gemmatimonadota bacterium]
AQFELADRWILSRCQHVVADTTDALERFRLNDAANQVYHFVWDELADWYLEQVKPRLYDQAPEGNVARAILIEVFETALRLLHPVMPFISEELWAHLPGNREPLLARAAWPIGKEQFVDDEAERQFAVVQALVTAVRGIRAEYHVAPSVTLTAVVAPATRETLAAINAEQGTVERLAKISDLTIADSAEGVGGHAVLHDGTSVLVPLGDAIDIAQECQRLRAERERLETQLERVAQKLANDQFMSRAPREVVERERDKEHTWREQCETLGTKLAALGC